MESGVLGSIGPYRILGLLGRGGIGAVYRAEDPAAGRLVAVKTLEQPMPAFLPTIRREISALARLDHPGIVRILGSGTHGGVPWYAMELIEGPNLLEHARDLPLSESLSCVHRLCAALAYLHGEGLVHRDLKPDNVLVRRDGQPVLVDFGVATSSGAGNSRETLEIEAGSSGTLQYMAPELLRGELVDARADLYSLGCMLYELLTGEPPFQPATAAELAEQQLHRSPEPPSERRPGLPPALDGLVLRLLAKSPRERLGYAGDLAAALESCGAIGALEESRARSYLYRPRVAGREPLLRQLEDRLIRLERGQGGLVLLGGESGAGKSRLALELGRRAEKRRIRVFGGECLPDLAGEPLRALRTPLLAIADRCRGRGEAETRRLLKRHGPVLAVYEPALEGLSGEVLPAPAQLPPEAARLRLFEALAETFLALAEDGPLLLLLDDLQWADGLSLGWLEHLLRSDRLSCKRLLIVGTYRIEERNAALDRLLGATGTMGLGLGRLEVQDVGQIVSDMLALSPPPELFVHFLARQSEGNPFFVAEYLRAAIGEGVLFRDSAGRWQVEGRETAPDSASLYESLPLPRSLHETVLRRLDALSAGARVLVECAAVLGREMQQDLLLELAQMREDRTWAPVEELLVRELFAEPQPGLLRFAHDKLREVAYEHTEPATRSTLHRRAAEALESRHGSGHPQDPAVLGGHWERAADPPRARGYYLEAARQRAARYAYAEAETLYRSALGLYPRPEPTSIAARIELGFVALHLLGRGPEAKLELETAIRDAESIGDRAGKAMGLNKLGYVQCRAGEYSESELSCIAALELARALSDPELEDDILSTFALMLKSSERFAEAEALYVELAARSPRLRIDALLHLSDILRGKSRLTEALARCEEALSEMRGTGQMEFESRIHGAMGAVHFTLGSLDEACKFLARAVELGRRQEDSYLVATYLGNLAAALSQQQRLEEARDHYEQAVELGSRLGFRSTVSVFSSNLGVVLEQLGQIDEALSALERARKLAREDGLKRTESAALLAMAAIERRAGFPELALGRLDRARALFPDEDHSDASVQVIHLCERGHLALAAGLTRAAASRLQEAQEVADRLHGSLQPQVQRSLVCLRNAIATFASGSPLFHGERWEDIPSGWKNWLTQRSDSFAK